METTLTEFERFTNMLVKYLSSAISRDVIPSKWIDGQEGSKERMLHGRMLGILAKTGDTLDYVVEIDSGFSYFTTGHNKRQFRPDIQLWSEEPKLQFLVEYEGTNSQDSRIFRKDLQYYHDSKDCEYPPQYWVILYTFPDHPVEKTPQWLRQENTFDSFTEKRFRRNPHSYFKGLLDSEISMYVDKGSNWEERKLFLMNFTSTGLEIDFPKNLRSKYQFVKTD